MEGFETPAARPLDTAANGREALARAIDDLSAAKARLARDAQALLAETKEDLVVRLLPILDNLDLEAVSEAAAARKRWEFLFTAAPIRITDGTGSPLNPIAMF